MSAPETPRRGGLTFDSPACKLEREETERGRDAILTVIPGAQFASTLREFLEEGAPFKVLRKWPPQSGNQ